MFRGEYLLIFLLGYLGSQAPWLIKTCWRPDFAPGWGEVGKRQVGAVLGGVIALLFHQAPLWAAFVAGIGAGSMIEALNPSKT